MIIFYYYPKGDRKQHWKYELQLLEIRTSSFEKYSDNLVIQTSEESEPP